jgi:hypothetical protein
VAIHQTMILTPPQKGLAQCKRWIHVLHCQHARDIGGNIPQPSPAFHVPSNSAVDWIISKESCYGSHGHAIQGTEEGVGPHKARTQVIWKKTIKRINCTYNLGKTQGLCYDWFTQPLKRWEMSPEAWKLAPSWKSILGGDQRRPSHELGKSDIVNWFTAHNQRSPFPISLAARLILGLVVCAVHSPLNFWCFPC